MHRALTLQSERRSRDDEEGDAGSAYEKLMEATKLLASAGLPLLAERLRSWPYRFISRPPTNFTAGWSAQWTQDKGP